MRYTLHFDGSCYPNPGGICAYGFHVDSDEDVPKTIYEEYGQILSDPRTNNVAEFEAAIHAIDWFVKFANNVSDSEHLTIFGDSDIVISSIKKNKHSRKPHILSLQDCLHELVKMLDGKWTARRVPRTKNRRADELASRIRKGVV